MSVLRKPIDWNRGAGRSSAPPPASVTIIIPIYGAAEALRRCLASVAAHTDLRVHRLQLVVDGPQDAAVDEIVAGQDHVLRNAQRLGFVGSVNRGMASCATDVVLLNSDTVVTPRWVEKLIDAAYSSGDIGTVTPLSNHATLCSVPRPFVENLLPNGLDAAAFGELVERASRRERPRIPTGVGVCLYIRRALIEDIGLFDAALFGLGYGEENDFCFRALARGWVHVADDATFIEHAGHASFGASRAALERASASALRRRHPRYMPTIAAFMQRDPLSAIRTRIANALGADRDGRRRIVHLVHGWPPFQQAGTEMYAAWLVRQQTRTHHVAVYTRGADPGRNDGEALEWIDDGVRVRFVTNHFTARNPLLRNAIARRTLERDFERFLREERPDLVHIHHLAGHAFSLATVAKRLGLPIVMQIQDWWFLCARVNLFDRDGRRCDGPAPAKCASCATLTRLPLMNRAIHAVRRMAAHEALAAADVLIAGSHAIRDDYARTGLVPSSKPFHVIPYGVDLVCDAPRRATMSPVRFGYVGSIQPHKGVHTAVEAMRGIAPGKASLHIWGDASAAPDYVATLRANAGSAEVIFEGKFPEEDKGRVFQSMDILLVPSIGLESFGLAAREAMVCGVPVVATEGGALSEMFAPGTCGAFFPAGDAEALHRILRRIADEPAIVDRWSAQLPVPKSSDAHAAEIERIYDEILGAR